MAPWLLKIKNKIKRMMLPRHHKGIPDHLMQPVFIIGTNRSGTSVVSSIFSQHPDLEGIFAGHTSPEYTQNQKHVNGYCESFHIWPWLIDPKSEFQRGGKYRTLWSHPSYISEHYRDSIENKSEGVDLLNAIEKFRSSTDKSPLIKDQFNLLRIGLIKDILPKAKFIFVVRNFEDFLPSCQDCWFEEDFQHPSIGQHWLMGNQTALYDLKKYYPGNYSLIHYNDILKNPDSASDFFKNACREIGISEHDFDCSFINKKFRFKKDEDNESIKLNSSLLNKTNDFEKEFYSGK